MNTQNRIEANRFDIGKCLNPVLLQLHGAVKSEQTAVQGFVCFVVLSDQVGSEIELVPLLKESLV